MFLLISLCTIFAGIILSESLSVTYWNGLSGIQQRFITAHSLNELSANRIDLWITTWDTIKNSPTFGQWFGIELSADNKKQLWIPEGFAHGFLALEDDTHFLYKATDYYVKDSEGAILWDDPNIRINWPQNFKMSISVKDLGAQPFSKLEMAIY